MSGYQARLQAIAAITSYKEPEAQDVLGRKLPTEIFGCNVFNDRVMRERLPKAVYRSVKRTIETGSKLDPSIADSVATAMKDWALSKGATHYTHVFYPLTGLTAEKHDSFLKPDDNGGAIAEFNAEQLIQGESDASSLPSGGIRATFEARGYTAWDVTNPAYILENPYGTFLCIPTAFVSWTGEALDKKTPLLRANQVINTQAKRVLRLFGRGGVKHINSYAGPEQEYFLVDRNFYFARADLIISGRTLFGAKPAKGQEFEDHYFGAIPRRVLSFMLDVEHELYKLGVPVITRHNETAPAQYEIAPLYENSNLATDHNQMIMSTLKSVAKRHGLACLLHEKPFAGINGSGKHLNYSIGCPELGSLFDPGETPHENAQFLVFCAAMIRGMHKYGHILRALVATASNDHRLGAQEAPPAIMSIFLGDQLTDIFTQIKEGGGAKHSKQKSVLQVGVDTLPPIPQDTGDRNRTSPFAFTGNRFEFRAVGSNMSIAGPQVALNTILAESLDYIATRLENDIQGDDKKLPAAVQKLLQEIITEHEDIIFNGDGYSDEWKEEAARRGLPNLATAVDALPILTQDATIALFEKYGVFSRRELESRRNIFFDQYRSTLRTEAALMIKISRTQIFPAAMRYQGELAATCANMKAMGVDFKTKTFDDVTWKLRDLQSYTDELDIVMKTSFDDAADDANYLCNNALPAMQKVRAAADHLENVVADNLWPLPSYQEMLFIK